MTSQPPTNEDPTQQHDQPDTEGEDQIDIRLIASDADRANGATLGGLPIVTDPGQVIRPLQELVERFEVTVRRHGVQKIKTIGDSFMGVAGLPDPAWSRSTA